MKTWFLLAVAASLMSFSGCEREKTVTPSNTSGLIGKWQLIEPGSYKVTLMIESIVQNTMIIPAKTLHLSGESAVNLYTASLNYKAQDQSEIIIEPVSTTKRAGSAEAMQFEQTYYAKLSAVNRYELTDINRLRFYHPGGVLVYEKMN